MVVDASSSIQVSPLTGKPDTGSAVAHSLTGVTVMVAVAVAVVVSVLVGPVGVTVGAGVLVRVLVRTGVFVLTGVLVLATPLVLVGTGVPVFALTVSVGLLRGVSDGTPGVPGVGVDVTNSVGMPITVDEAEGVGVIVSGGFVGVIEGVDVSVPVAVAKSLPIMMNPRAKDIKRIVPINKNTSRIIKSPEKITESGEDFAGLFVMNGYYLFASILQSFYQSKTTGNTSPS